MLRQIPTAEETQQFRVRCGSTVQQGHYFLVSDGRRRDNGRGLGRWRRRVGEAKASGGRRRQEEQLQQQTGDPTDHPDPPVAGGREVGHRGLVRHQHTANEEQHDHTGGHGEL